MQTLQKGWNENLKAGAPRPEKWLLSPMTRAADTMALTWGRNLRDVTPVFCEVSGLDPQIGSGTFLEADSSLLDLRHFVKSMACRPTIAEGTR